MMSRLPSTGRRSLAILAVLALVPARAAGGGDCTGTSTGLVPLSDLPPALYQDEEGGLYPGASNPRPRGHERAADLAARARLLDASGRPDALGGRIVLLSVGMSNTTIEFRRFMELARSEPALNRAVVLVDGAQGGWSADRLADPQQNGSYWDTVQARLAAAGVSAAQVQAVWLKEADARPTLDFPDDALKLQMEIETIIRDVRSRFPNAAQVYLSSRIYAGYATTALNPEPFAYQSGFAVKWTIEGQILGDPALNFDPARGEVVAPWLSWGPYLWSDGLRPRSDGLIWECDDFQDDGTHPSAKGAMKVATALLAFFKQDTVTSRWFVDCDPGDPGVFAPAPEVLGLTIARPEAQDLLGWDDLDAVAGVDTTYDVVTGSLSALQETRDFSLARCAAAGLPLAAASLPEPDPEPGEAVYYLVRGRNACGDGTFGEDLPGLNARARLDEASPCR